MLSNISNTKVAYNTDEYGFNFIFYRKPNQNDTINDTVNDTINDTIKCNINTVNLILSVNETQVFFEIAKNCTVTREELSRILSKGTATISRIQEALVSKGYIKRIGSRKTGYWEILKSL